LYLYVVEFVRRRCLFRFRVLLDMSHDDLDRSGASGLHWLGAAAVDPGEDFRERERVKAKHFQRFGGIVIGGGASKNFSNVSEKSSNG
jgi:hypothetical protein